MNNQLYIIAILLAVLWAAGFFAFKAGNMVHMLLAMAIVALLLRLIKNKEPAEKQQF